MAVGIANAAVAATVQVGEGNGMEGVLVVVSGEVGWEGGG